MPGPVRRPRQGRDSILGEVQLEEILEEEKSIPSRQDLVKFVDRSRETFVDQGLRRSEKTGVEHLDEFDMELDIFRAVGWKAFRQGCEKTLDFLFVFGGCGGKLDLQIEVGGRRLNLLRITLSHKIGRASCRERV